MQIAKNYCLIMSDNRPEVIIGHWAGLLEPLMFLSCNYIRRAENHSYQYLLEQEIMLHIFCSSNNLLIKVENKIIEMILA